MLKKLSNMPKDTKLVKKEKKLEGNLTTSIQSLQNVCFLEPAILSYHKELEKTYNLYNYVHNIIYKNDKQETT